MCSHRTQIEIQLQTQLQTLKLTTTTFYTLWSPTLCSFLTSSLTILFFHHCTLATLSFLFLRTVSTFLLQAALLFPLLEFSTLRSHQCLLHQVFASTLSSASFITLFPRTPYPLSPALLFYRTLTKIWYMYFFSIDRLFQPESKFYKATEFCFIPYSVTVTKISAWHKTGVL